MTFLLVNIIDGFFAPDGMVIAQSVSGAPDWNVNRNM